MKVLPIANNNYKNSNISSKGHVSNNLQSTLESCIQPLKHNLNLAKTYPDKYPTLITFLEGLVSFNSNYADNIVKNMQTIMSRFGKSCVLDLKQSEKNPDKKLFVIESEDSSYKHICGKIECGINAGSLSVIDKFSTETLAKINPYEINARFMSMWQPHEMSPAVDKFEAEKDIWFISDELIKAEPSYKNGGGMSLEELVKCTHDLEKEDAEFQKKFGDKL